MKEEFRRLRKAMIQWKNKERKVEERRGINCMAVLQRRGYNKCVPTYLVKAR